MQSYFLLKISPPDFSAFATDSSFLIVGDVSTFYKLLLCIIHVMPLYDVVISAHVSCGCIPSSSVLKLMFGSNM